MQAEQPDYDYDLDALVVEEENAPPFRFRWGGKTFEMPLALAMPFDDQLSLENATLTESMQIIMGDEAFDELMRTPGPDGRQLSTGRIKGLIEAWHKHQGLELGESRPSPRSSANTARRSRRTSRSARR